MHAMPFTSSVMRPAPPLFAILVLVTFYSYYLCLHFVANVSFCIPHPYVGPCPPCNMAWAIFSITLSHQRSLHLLTAASFAISGCFPLPYVLRMIKIDHISFQISKVYIRPQLPLHCPGIRYASIGCVTKLMQMKSVFSRSQSSHTDLHYCGTIFFLYKVHNSLNWRIPFKHSDGLLGLHNDGECLAARLKENAFLGTLTNTPLKWDCNGGEGFGTRGRLMEAAMRVWAAIAANKACIQMNAMAFLSCVQLRLSANGGSYLITHNRKEGDSKLGPFYGVKSMI
eukprot:Gb_09880 [translate_table: standard]